MNFFLFLDHRKAELERLKKVEENINKEAQEKEFEKKRIRENPPGLRVFPHEPFLHFHPKARYEKPLNILYTSHFLKGCL